MNGNTVIAKNGGKHVDDDFVCMALLYGNCSRIDWLILVVHADHIEATGTHS